MESVSLTELSSLVENVHIKTQETSQNTDFVLQNFLGINKALQSMQGELVNNTSKFVEIDKRIKKDSKNLKEVENDPTYSEKQRQLYRDASDNLKTEQQARIKQTIKKVIKRKRNKFSKTQYLIIFMILANLFLLFHV